MKLNFETNYRNFDNMNVNLIRIQINHGIYQYHLKTII
jgi:hypothetical protein